MPAHISPDYNNTPDAARADCTLQQHLDQFMEESLQEALSRSGDGQGHMAVLPQETRVETQDARVSSKSTSMATQNPVAQGTANGQACESATARVLPGGRLDAGGFGLDQRETVNLEVASGL